MKEVYPESFRSKGSHMFLIREETETYSWEGDVKMEPEIGVMWPSTKECWQPPEAKRGKELNLPRDSRRTAGLRQHRQGLQTRSQTRSLHNLVLRPLTSGATRRFISIFFGHHAFERESRKKGGLNHHAWEMREICSILACLRDKIRNLTKHWVESRERKGQRRE